MSREAHSERFFSRGGGSNPNGDRTMAARGRARGLGRNRGSIRIVEDGQPNDNLSRNRDVIPSVRATHRPYRHNKKRGKNVFPSRRTSQNPPMFPRSKYNPPTGPRALSSANPICNLPSRPAAECDSFQFWDDLAPRKRRRTESLPPTVPNTHIHFHTPSPTPANHEHSSTRATGPRSCTTAPGITVKCDQLPLDFPVNAKRESSPIVIDMLDCPPSPPLLEKLGLLEKTSGSYHVAMIDECRKGAISYVERRQEWKDAILNSVRFARGHDSPPLIIDRCFIRSDGMTVDWSVPNDGTPPDHASSNGFGATALPAPALHPSIALRPVVDQATPPLIRRLAPLPTSTPAHPVDTSDLGEVPVESTGSSVRSTTRSLPKGVAKNAIPVKVFDVPESLLGEVQRKDRNNWKNRAIIELGNPNYKGAFATTREKGPEGKWIAVGMDLHIYDTGEWNPPALPKEIHGQLLKEKDTNPTRNMDETTEGASAPAENSSIDTTMPESGWGDTLSSVFESLAHQRPSSSALASQRTVYLENPTDHTLECYFTHQSPPPFHGPTTSPAIGAPTSVAQPKQRVSNRKQSLPSSSFAPIAPLPESAGAHLPRTVAPVRSVRRTTHPEEPVFLSADISAHSIPHSTLPRIIRTESESEPILPPSSCSLPETVLPQPSRRTTKQSEPSQPLLGIQFDSLFCSGSNAVESLSDIAGGFLQRFFGFLESREKARISSGYSEEAVMSWQLNNLPSIGVCPQVGNPQAQGHQITEVPRWLERNLLLQGHWSRRPVCGKADIVKRLETMADLKLSPSPGRDPEYKYEALDLGIGGLVQVRCWGNLHRMVDDESHVALRFERTFILEKNRGAARIVWPWIVLSDQMTFFHRPGILCQCLGGRRTQSSSTARA